MTKEKSIYPVKNVPEWAVAVYYVVGKATASIKNRGPANRRFRYEQMQHLRKDQTKLKEINQKTRLWDEFDRQFQIPKELEIDGNITHYVDISIPGLAEKLNREKEPPVIVFCAYAGDHFGVEALIREIVLSGRRVLCFDWPEATMGKTTPEFVSLVQNCLPYQAHANVSQKVIEQILPNQEFDAVGYSGGAAVAAVLAQNPQIGSQIRHLIAIAPPSTVDRGLLKKKNLWLKLGFIKEIVPALLNLSKLTDSGLVIDNPPNKANSNRRNTITRSWFNWIPHKVELFNNLRNTGNTIVVSGKYDNLTNSTKADVPETRHIILEESHLSLMINAVSTWEKIEKFKLSSVETTSSSH